MEDVHYLEACASKFNLDADRFHKECVRKVAKVYESNMNSVWNLLGFPPLISIIASLYRQAALDCDKAISSGKERLPAPHLGRGDQRNKKFFNDLVEKRTNEMVAWLKRHPEDDREETTNGYNNFSYFIQLFEGEHIEDGVRALLESAIKNSWTAYEVLCQDLLKEVRKHFPTCFENVEIDVNDAKCRSRGAIRRAYLAAFPVDYRLITEGVDDEALDALALLRNVLAHKAGSADDEFLGEAKYNSLLSQYHSHVEGQRVQIDGKVIKSVVLQASRAGCLLLWGVDTWITMAHPT